MTDLPTAAAHRAIAGSPIFSGGVFNDGAFRRAASGGTFPTVTPASGETRAEAAALANDTPYGLAASVYTGNLRDAIRWQELRAGRES